MRLGMQSLIPVLLQAQSGLFVSFEDFSTYIKTQYKSSPQTFVPFSSMPLLEREAASFLQVSCGPSAYENQVFCVNLLSGEKSEGVIPGNLSTKALNLGTAWFFGTRAGHLVKHLVRHPSGVIRGLKPSSSPVFPAFMKETAQKNEKQDGQLKTTGLKFGWQWIQTRPSPWIGEVLISKETLVAQTVDGELVAVNEDSGKVLWSASLPLSEDPIKKTPLLKIIGSEVWFLGKGLIQTYDLASGEKKRRLETPLVQKGEGGSFPLKVLFHKEENWVDLLFEREFLRVSLSDLSIRWSLKGPFRTAHIGDGREVWLTHHHPAQMVRVSSDGLIEETFSFSDFQTLDGSVSFVNELGERVFFFFVKKKARSFLLFSKENQVIFEQPFPFRVIEFEPFFENKDRLCLSTDRQGLICLGKKPLGFLGLKGF